jgi:hypothetical protein
VIGKGKALGIAALCFVLALSATTLAAATTVKVDPATQDVLAGDPFSINVSIDNVTFMNADQARVNFDPTVMSASGVTEGDFLKSAGTTIAVGPTIDNINGRVTFAYSLTNPNLYVNGSGVLATIDFDTDPSAPAGSYPLTLTNVLIANSTGPMIVDEILNGTVNITGRAAAEPVPAVNGLGIGAVIGLLALVLALSVTATRKKRH